VSEMSAATYKGHRIHDLCTGNGDFNQLIVQAHSVDGNEDDGKGDPFFFGTVKDETGFATLVYRNNHAQTGFKASQFKPGRYFVVSGKVIVREIPRFRAGTEGAPAPSSRALRLRSTCSVGIHSTSNVPLAYHRFHNTMVSHSSKWGVLGESLKRSTVGAASFCCGCGTVEVNDTNHTLASFLDRSSQVATIA